MQMFVKKPPSEPHPSSSIMAFKSSKRPNKEHFPRSVPFVRMVPMVVHWNHVIDRNAILPKLFETAVWNFLLKIPNQPILFWLDDSYSLIHHSREGRSSIPSHGNMNYYDYSFMIIPAFKALELWIINIAPHLGVTEKLIAGAKEHGRFNSFLNDDNIEKLVRAVSKKLSLQATNKRDLRQSLGALNAYLKNLRHTPAHCGLTISSPDKANIYFNEIVGAIDRLTAHLIKDGIIAVQ